MHTLHTIRPHLSALLARLAEFRPVIIAAEQEAVLLKVPARQRRIAGRTAEAFGMPLLAQGANVSGGVEQRVSAARATRRAIRQRRRARCGHLIC